MSHFHIPLLPLSSPTLSQIPPVSCFSRQSLTQLNFLSLIFASYSNILGIFSHRRQPMLLLPSHPFLFHVHSSACSCLEHYQLLYPDILLQFCLLVNFLSVFSFCHFSPSMANFSTFDHLPKSLCTECFVVVVFFGLQSLSQSDLTGELPSL